MTIKCQINRAGKDERWQVRNGGNTRVADGTVGADAIFGNRASDETIIRSYLRTYNLAGGEDVDNLAWWEVTIYSSPGQSDRHSTYYVQVLPGLKWAVVQSETPRGELRYDGRCRKLRRV